MIPLVSAYLCIDCEMIFDQVKQGLCPHCGAISIHSLSKWIAPINEREGMTKLLT